MFKKNFILNYFDIDWALFLQTDQQNKNHYLESFLTILFLGYMCSIKKINKYKIFIKYSCSPETHFYYNFILIAKDAEVKEKFNKEYKDCKNLLSTNLKQSRSRGKTYLF